MHIFSFWYLSQFLKNIDTSASYIFSLLVYYLLINRVTLYYNNMNFDIMQLSHIHVNVASVILVAMLAKNIVLYLSYNWWFKDFHIFLCLPTTTSFLSLKLRTFCIYVNIFIGMCFLCLCTWVYMCVCVYAFVCSHFFPWKCQIPILSPNVENSVFLRELKTYLVFKVWAL